MAKLQRKSAKVFAENASAGIGGIAQFGSLAAGNPNFSKDVDVIQALQAYKNGWTSAVTGNKSPALEDRNALDYLLSYQQAYLMQRGVPEWLDTETYYVGSFVSLDNGRMYVSKVDNNTNHNPSTDTSETYWIAFPTPQELSDGLALKVAKAGDTMTGDLAVQANISATGSIVGQTVYNSASGTNYRTLDTRDIPNVGSWLDLDFSAIVDYGSTQNPITLTQSGMFIVTIWQGTYASCNYSVYDSNDNLLWSQQQMSYYDSNTAFILVTKGYKFRVTYANSAMNIKYVPLKSAQ